MIRGADLMLQARLSLHGDMERTEAFEAAYALYFRGDILIIFRAFNLRVAAVCLWRQLLARAVRQRL